MFSSSRHPSDGPSDRPDSFGLDSGIASRTSEVHMGVAERVRVNCSISSFILRKCGNNSVSGLGLGLTLS